MNIDNFIYLLCDIFVMYYEGLLKKMKKLITILAAITLCCTLSFAQDKKAPDLETNDDYVFKMNQSGDYFLKLNINTGIPILPEQLKFGMDLNFGAYYLFTSWFGLGGSISFNYNPTIGQKVFYYIPVIAQAFFQLEIWHFEIPLFIGVGGAFEHHSSNFYFGLVIKPEIGLYYRINPEWSVGASFAASIIPQWYTHKNSSGNYDYNYVGYILNPGISARYHL